MVLSVAAVASPAAAQPIDSADRTVDQTEVNAGGSTTVTLTVEVGEDADSISIQDSFDPEFAEVSNLNVEFQNGDGSTVFTNAENGSVTVAASADAGTTIVVTYDVTVVDEAPATHTISGEVVSGDQTVTPTGDTEVNVVEQVGPSITFDGQTSAGSSVNVASYNLGDNGSTVAVWSTDDAGNPDEVLGSVSPSSSSGSLNVALNQQISGTQTLVAAVHSGDTSTEILASDTAEVTVETPPGDAEVVDGGTFFVGQVLYTNAYDTGDQVVLRDGDGTFQSDVPVEDGTVTLRTANRNEGIFQLTSPTGPTIEFELVEQDYDISPSEVEVTNEGDGAAAEITVASNRGTYTHVLSSESLSASDLQSVLGTGTIGPEGETLLVSGTVDQTLAADFTGVPAGDYQIDFGVTDTTASDTVNVSVEAAAPGQVTFDSDTKVIQEQLGDRARIPLSFQNSDTAQLELGSDDLRWRVSLTVTDADDDGSATVLVNTDNIRQTGTVFAAAGDDTVSNVEVLTGGQFTSPDRRIAATAYPMSVSVNGDETDVATLSLQDPSQVERSLSVSRARAGLSFEDALANQEESSTVASSDWVVMELQAAGIFGYIGEDAAADLAAGEDGVSLSISETSLDRNEEGDSVDPSVFVTSVDEASNTITLAAKVNEANGFEIGETYRATFQVAEANPYVDAAVTRSVQFTTAPRAVSIDFAGDRLRVQQAASQTISGSTTMATGTQVTVTIRSTGESVEGGQPFLRSKTTTVQNGAWSVDFDFGDIPPGQTFTVAVRSAGASDDAAGVVTQAASVSMSSQISQNGQVLLVDSVFLPNAGFVTIHDETLQDGETLGSVLGTSRYLPPGSHEDVRVTLDEPIEETQNVIAMAHQDTNGNAVYDFVDQEGGADGPYTLGGEAVTDDAQVQIPTEETPTATPTATPTETPTETPTDGDGDGDGAPGFGLGIAVLALLAAALLAARRRE